jgi:hypothetical protein
MSINFKLETEVKNEFGGVVTVYGLPSDGDNYHYIIGGQKRKFSNNFFPENSGGIKINFGEEFKDWVKLQGRGKVKEKLEYLPKDKLILKDNLPSEEIGSILNLGFLWYYENYNRWIGCIRKDLEKLIEKLPFPDSFLVHGDIPIKKTKIQLPIKVSDVLEQKDEEEIEDYVRKRCEENYKERRILSLPIGEIYNFANPTEENYGEVDLKLISLFEKGKIKKTPDGRIYVVPKDLVSKVKGFPPS